MCVSEYARKRIDRGNDEGSGMRAKREMRERRTKNT
jgi:hypothetical protein